MDYHRALNRMAIFLGKNLLAARGKSLPNM